MRLFRKSSEPKPPKPHKHRWTRTTETITTRWSTTLSTYRECYGCGVKEKTGGWFRDDLTGEVTPYEPKDEDNG